MYARKLTLVIYRIPACPFFDKLYNFIVHINAIVSWWITSAEEVRDMVNSRECLTKVRRATFLRHLSVECSL